MFEFKKKVQISSDNVKEIQSNGIAVIGIAAQMPNAKDYRGFWEILDNSADCIGPFPENRKKDIDDILAYLEHAWMEKEYAPGGYLEHIDQFDHEFFKLSAKEASLMDPNQRLFLETAWSSLEDAGYCNSKIMNSNTGIYLGYSGISEYQRILAQIHPELLVMSEAGNINSIIASRIAYLLDLKGPSMLVDTACSSSLVAVSMAMQALRNQKCDMAIAGSVKVLLAPVETDEKLGIESSSGKTKTFDDSSDGTVLGEGAISLVLKMVDKAIQDGDHIYAVLKGYAINQDGSSVGITAPNVLAQEQLLIDAWSDAMISPETITYIEAHGTGTKLGDPIEVKAIANAFGKFTNKKAFCAVSSAKSVVGHLDHAAGMAGLLRAIYSLKYEKIPASLHFLHPNQKIDFVQSAVYINDQVTQWEPHCGIRRCGVSSFGLSGTNCHIVLEQAPELTVKKEMPDQKHIFAVSARSERALLDRLKQMESFLLHNESSTLSDICYSLSVKRNHYNYRLAIIVDDLTSLIEKLNLIIRNKEMLKTSRELSVFYGSYHLVSENEERKKETDISESQLQVYSRQASDYFGEGREGKELLPDLCSLYCQGANIPWDRLYPKRDVRHVPLPAYPFQRKRCWMKVPKRKVKETISKQDGQAAPLHPFVHRMLADSVEQNIYSTVFRVEDYWVLSEHMVLNDYLMPGTAYIEMVNYCCNQYFKGAGLEFRNIIFMKPFVLKENEEREIQTVLRKKDQFVEFVITSKTSVVEEWEIHCQGSVYINQENALPFDRLSIQNRCEKMSQDHLDRFSSEDMNDKLHFGERWSSLITSVAIGKNEVLAELYLPDKFADDLNEFALHPSLMDIAVNVVTQSTGYGLYLPMSYGSLKVYGPLTQKLYSHIRRKSNDHEAEAIVFDLTIADSNHNVLLEASNYTIKHVNKAALSKEQNDMYYAITWEKYDSLPAPSPSQKLQDPVIVFSRDKRITAPDYLNVIHVSPNNLGTDMPGVSYSNIRTQSDYDTLFKNLKDDQPASIVHMLSMNDDFTKDVDQEFNHGVISARRMIKAIVNNGYAASIAIYFVIKNAYSVSGNEKIINPYSAALCGYGKSIEKEYPNLKVRCIDVDDGFDLGEIWDTIQSCEWPYQIAIRDSQKYIEKIDVLEIDQTDTQEFQWKKDGAYIITGGTGGIGMAMTQSLLDLGIQVALISRNGETERNTEALSLLKKQAASSGGSLEVYMADITDKPQIANALNEIRDRFDRIHGVIHLAGAADDAYIMNKEEEQADKVLQPKMLGTWLLDQLTREDDLQFFILSSSISSMLGEAGQADYTAANVFQDSYCDYRNSQGRNTICFNWPAWKNIGIASRFNIQDGVLYSLTDMQAMQAFYQVIGSHYKRVIVGTMNMQIVSANYDSIPLRLSGRLMKGMQPAVKKDHLKSNHKKVPATNERQMTTLQRVKLIWMNLFESEEIDINMSFSDMGGDSIMATYLLKEIDKEFPGQVDIASIFNYPTVSKLSDFIESKQVKKEPPGKPEPSKETSAPSEDELDLLIQGLADGSISVEEAIYRKV
ncbi:MAG: SDR family NAD(P)-dependent oxidoreductase [Paenibacillus dendritiformis]|uniref:type I polyketide synthase n=1 Tax=uncultured Paenibacillus sp. TaxID=227322 RepID=UPI0025F7D7D7|nr:SDR family NAD(P)-dependent oxidoreductase [uncultured Paenibacillus sp.]MDU5141930.1 SDR family NAD(P)-dependent oxidoreductase [Paenibacillus dendritiformis]